MKKPVKITLICVGAALGAMLLVIAIMAAIIGIYSSGLEIDKKTTEFTMNWMSNIVDSTRVKDIVIPGSHDSGTSTLNWLGSTQDVDTATQLEMGVRYFDLRVRKKDDELRIFHGPLTGAEFEPILTGFKTFLAGHPTETVILDFQHFDGQSQDDVAALVKSVLVGESNEYVVCNTESEDDVQFIDDLTLSTCRGRALIFWGSDDDHNLSEPYLFKRNDDEGNREGACLQSYYVAEHNKKSSEKYIAEGLPEYIERYKASGKGLFVLQGQLTDGMFIFGPKFRERAHRQNMSDYIADLAQSEDLKYINIIMRDYSDGEINCEIIKLNLDKNTVKPEQRTSFIAGLNEFITVTE